jgi:hypothetical protein
MKQIAAVKRLPAKGATSEYRATSDSARKGPHLKYAPIHPWRLYKIAHLGKDSIRSRIIYFCISISVSRMASVTSAISGNDSVCLPSRMRAWRLAGAHFARRKPEFIPSHDQTFFTPLIKAAG